MLVSLNWLRDFVSYNGEISILAEKLTQLGLEVDEIKEPFGYLKNFVVGKVLVCEKHPSSDHLSICKVDIGIDILDIVCGAPNVAQNQKVPVATVGTNMPDGFVIKKTKLRGAPSHGMICSAKELHLSSDHAGIMILDENLSVGSTLDEALGLQDWVLDISVTANRGDCLSMIGIAREIGAAFELPMNLPISQCAEIGRDIALEIKITADNEKCMDYRARLIENVCIKPSPTWMQNRLLSVGLRPINNIVDITNYIMMETGQPLHAFDKDSLKGNLIQVKNFTSDFEFITLDGQVRKIERTDLCICDEDSPIALAGVMGGKNSEITDKSTNVFLEAAIFEPFSIRRTAKRLALPSASSYRFERGIDPNITQYALDRAASLIAELANGQIRLGVAKSVESPVEKSVILFRPTQVFTLIGLNFSAQFCEKILLSLGCKIFKNNENWEVTPPSWRLDLEREADLIEEIVRLNGMDKIPEVLPRVRKKNAQTTLDTNYKFSQLVKKWGQGLGLTEVINYSFVSSKDLDVLQIPTEGRVTLFNPLTEEQNVLRPELVPSMLHSARTNIARGNMRVAIFEVAHSFCKNDNLETKTQEKNKLAILLHGSRYPEQYPYGKKMFDYADIKGFIESLVERCGKLELKFEKKSEHHYLQPSVKCFVNNCEFGIIGCINSQVCEYYDAREDIWYAELDLDLLQKIYVLEQIKFVAVSKFPSSSRDVTFSVSQNISAAEIVNIIKSTKTTILEDVRLIDNYIAQDSSDRSLTYRLTYRHNERTLQDKEVDNLQAKIVQNVLKNILD